MGLETVPLNIKEGFSRKYHQFHSVIRRMLIPFNCISLAYKIFLPPLSIPFPFLSKAHINPLELPVFLLV